MYIFPGVFITNILQWYTLNMNSNNNVSKMIACENWNCLRNRKNALNKLKGLIIVRSQKWATDDFCVENESKMNKIDRQIRWSKMGWGHTTRERRRINWPGIGKGRQNKRNINTTAISNKTSNFQSNRNGSERNGKTNWKKGH